MVFSQCRGQGFLCRVYIQEKMHVFCVPTVSREVQLRLNALSRIEDRLSPHVQSLVEDQSHEALSIMLGGWIS